MSELWKGIAIVGIWMGTGISIAAVSGTINEFFLAPVIVLCALIGTVAVSLS